MKANFNLTYLYTCIFLLSITFSFAQSDWKYADSGMRFKFYEINEKAKKPAIGDLASLHLVIKSEKEGVEIKNSYKEKGGKPLLFPVRVPSFPGDIYEAVSMMAPGDSAAFLLDTDSMFAYVFKKPVPGNIDPEGNLHCTIKMIESENQKDYLQELRKKDSLKLVARKEEYKARFKKEQAQIKEYLKAHNYTSEEMESGLHIVKTETTDGKKPESHKTALINYTVWLLDGKKIESTEDIGKPFAFNIDENMVIKGWEEGVKNMRVGEKAYLIIPSHIGYREKNIAGKIPPYSVLVIYVELLSVR